MQIRLYLDEDAMDNDLVRALRMRGLDVITALDVGLIGSIDLDHLELAIESGRVLYSFNVSDFMNLHTQFLATGRNHARDHFRPPTTLWCRRTDAAHGPTCPNAIG